MRPEELITLLRAAPFRPFRIVMNAGKTYDIRHPELAKVGRSAINIYSQRDLDSPYDRYDIVSLLLIERIEFLDAVPAAGK